MAKKNFPMNSEYQYINIYKTTRLQTFKSIPLEEADEEEEPYEYQVVENGYMSDPSPTKLQRSTLNPESIVFKPTFST